MTAAAFQASYADFKLIKTRGVVSISFEVPVEQAQLALDVLGGMPVAAAEVHCAIARLNPEREVMQNKASPISDSRPAQHDKTAPRQEEAKPSGGAKTAFRDMRMPNQAGILCDTKSFQRFLAEKLNWNEKTTDFAHGAVVYVRHYCGVKSRSDIRPRTPSGDRWQKLVDEYRAWMHKPEYA